MRWKLYYNDGSSFSDEDGAPNDSPPFGAVFVCQPNHSGRDLIWGTDYLIHRTDVDAWMGTDLVGLIDQLSHFAPYIDCVRAGREMVTPAFKALMHEAAVEMRGR